MLLYLLQLNIALRNARWLTHLAYVCALISSPAKAFPEAKGDKLPVREHTCTPAARVFLSAKGS